MIALVDCDAFYVSCEKVFNPALEGRPIVIMSNNDGCAVSLNPEAKALGIKRGSPVFQMEKFLRDQQVAVFSSNYPLYGDLSDRVMNCLASQVEHLEVYSIDEAFLDLYGYELTRPDLAQFAGEIRQTVKEWTGIPTSIGLGKTKTLAKVAAKLAKHQGVYCLSDTAQTEEVLREYPVDELWGIGRQYARKLARYGIRTALQLTELHDDWLQKNLTVQGLRLAYELRGVPCRPLEEVVPNKKAICTARSFGRLLREQDLVLEALANFVATCARKLRKQRSAAHWVTVLLETNRFRKQDRQHNAVRTVTLPVASNQTPTLIKYAQAALQDIWREGHNYKKVGCIVSGLAPQDVAQLDLFRRPDERVDRLMSLMDQYNLVNGPDKIRLAAQGFDRRWRLRQEKLSPCRTTKWSDIQRVH